MPSMGPGAIIKAETFAESGNSERRGTWGNYMDWHLRAKELGVSNVQVVLRRRLHASNQSREREQLSPRLRANPQGFARSAPEPAVKR